MMGKCPTNRFRGAMRRQDSIISAKFAASTCYRGQRAKNTFSGAGSRGMTDRF
jgi:hypothetical protein